MTETGHRFDPTVLREYDIRGIVGETLSAADAVAIGRTLASIAAEGDCKFVCIGYDGRESSPELEAGVVEGVTAAGLAAVRVGLVATPMLYFASKMLGAAAAVMVTGSHNPPAYNGFKLVVDNKPFWGRDIRRLGARSADGDWVEGDVAAQGTAQRTEIELDVMAAYVARLASDYRAERGLKVVWDAGNGSIGPAMEELVQRIPGEHVLLNENVDASFPAHHPDPAVAENLKQLQMAVTGMDYDLGVAFDGDGDRIGAVDGTGRIVWGDQLLAIYAADLLARVPGATVIADVKSSQMLFDEIARLGGEPVMSGTGHSVIKARMAEIAAPLAGEMSGHMFFADGYYGYDDALYAALRLVDIVARGDRSLAEMLDDLPALVNTPEIRFEVPEERKFAIVDEVKARLAATGASEDLEITDIDGVRVKGPDGWWLLRASNTQNVLVVRCESGDEAGLARLKEAVVGQLMASGIETAPF